MAHCGVCQRYLYDERADYLCSSCRFFEENDPSKMIREVTIESYDEKEGPPHDVMNIAVVDGVAFLEIATYDETHQDRTQTQRASFGVKLDDLVDALEALNRSDVRERLSRERRVDDP